MQPATAAAQNASTTAAPITATLRNFYQNIAGTPTSQQAEGDISSFNKLTPASADILRSFDTQYGVDAQAQRVGDLRKSVMNAEDLVNNVDQNVFARTSNALVSDAQRQRLVSAEKDPLVKQLGVISRNFDLANQDLSGLREQSNRFSSAELGDINTMRESLGGRLTTAQQREEVERQRKQQEEENRRWWENFALEQRKTDAYVRDLEEQRRLTARQIDASSAASNALLRQATAAAAPRPQAAPEVQSLPTLKAPSLLSGSNISNAINGGYFQDQIGRTGQAIAKYGPMALIGKGIFW